MATLVEIRRKFSDLGRTDEARAALLGLLRAVATSAAQRLARTIAAMGRCERCGERPASPTHCRTMYHWDGHGEDPNRDPVLCRDCAEEYHADWDAQWDEQWDEYNEYSRGRI